MSKITLHTLTDTAMFTALALILDKIPLFTMPQGGSVSLVMLPILLLSLRHGTLIGLLSGFIIGSLQLFFGGYFLNIFQVVLDYVLSYAGIGLAGILATPLKKSSTFSLQVLVISFASLIGGAMRFLGNFLAGGIFYGDYAPKGTPVWLYSLIYNLSYILPSTAIALLALILIIKFRPDFIKTH